MLSQILPFLIPAVIIVLIIVIFAGGYLKAPPDTAFVISGLKKEPRVLIGRAGVKIPFLERKDTLLCKQISVDIKTNGAIPTKDFIGVEIDAIAKVQIMTEGPGLKLAMKNFLNMKERDIILALTDSLQGNMREIIGTVELKELCTDRKNFGDQVQEKAQVDMNNLGIKIISCNIQKMEDKEGLILALGQDNMSQIKKNASIAKAQADRDVIIAQAAASEAANDAKVKADTEIAVRNNELAIKQSDLRRQADIKKAEADAAYEIQKQEQRKTIEITSAEANIAAEAKNVELEQQKASVREQTLTAEIKKKADADLYAAQREAEARLFEEQKAAEARLFAAKQDAEGIRLKGLAEAEAIRAKGVAEAEAIEKKAEAMSKMGEAAVLEMYFNALPEVMKNAAQPLQNVDKITMYGEGNSAKMVKDIVNGVTQVTEGLKESSGVDLQALISGFLGGKIAKDAQDGSTASDQEA
ncbi:MAG: flotillin family protein [Lachnospiraceae bacterium]|nr:flotillin family protein [Lachnospiraceae bacterium]